ncbi:hypothetical protein BLL41_21410 [Bacillus sp. FMQ74]|uniref:helix-turn-helix domain-containing protein n=1 Tax=Bacillus sp. FMQ74 TaxID=1913579 RepID=UPI0008FB8D1D|nr:helix-turn-helix domain-containing protein [Bacillus sp. FMQ74]OIR59268.1 hypothetical protein BLL41_21410 [Bacillus sp. FMQ74]
MDNKKTFPTWDDIETIIKNHGKYIVLTSRMKNGELKPYLLGPYKTYEDIEKLQTNCNISILKVVELASKEHEQVLEYVSKCESEPERKTKLTKELIEEIQRLANENVPPKEIAEKYGIARSTVSKYVKKAR